MWHPLVLNIMYNTLKNWLNLQNMRRQWDDSTFNADSTNTFPTLDSSEPDLLKKGFSHGYLPTYTHAHKLLICQWCILSSLRPTSRPLGWSDATHHMQTATGNWFNSMTDSYPQYHTQGKRRGYYYCIAVWHVCNLTVVTRAWKV